MALVRCPIHKIPYNEDHPRGCPACAREKEGDVHGSAIQELAKASKTLRQTAGADPSPSEAGAATPAPNLGADAPWPAVESVGLGLLQRSRIRRYIWLGGGLVVAALVMWLVARLGPRFIEARFPAAAADVRPLPLEPNTPIATAFAALGVRQPRPHPETPQLARYQYGADLSVDALNGRVYAMTIAVPNWSWRGIRVGLPARNAEGALALLGHLSALEHPDSIATQVVGGYDVYPSVVERPRTTRRVEVRPPNGCYDVTVELRPQVVGLLVDGDRRFAVIGPQGSAPQWVVTRIQVISRTLPDPTSGGVIC